MRTRVDYSQRTIIYYTFSVFLGVLLATDSFAQNGGYDCNKLGNRINCRPTLNIPDFGTNMYERDPWCYVTPNSPGPGISWGTCTFSSKEACVKHREVRFSDSVNAALEKGATCRRNPNVKGDDD